MSELPISARSWQRWIALIPLMLSGLWFFLLEKTITNPVYLMYARPDDLIPFIPLFVVPYVIWYFYVTVPAVFLFLKAPLEFCRMAAFLSLGMMIACAAYTLFPNGQALRPALENHEGSFVAVIRFLYAIDTPINSAPSIHVVYSIAAHAAISRYNSLRRRSCPVNVISLTLAVLCALSTVFIKQHSIIDMVLGLLLSGLLYLLLYGLQRTGYGSRRIGYEQYARIQSSYEKTIP